MNRAAKKQPQNPAVKWATRVGAAVVFLVMIAMAVMDYQAKNHATSTTTAWLNALKTAADNEQELPCSELASHISGSPGTSGDFSHGEMVYTWNGILRTYTTTVTCEDEDDPVVLKIEGPGS